MFRCDDWRVVYSPVNIPKHLKQIATKYILLKIHSIDPTIQHSKSIEKYHRSKKSYKHFKKNYKCRTRYTTRQSSQRNT